MIFTHTTPYGATTGNKSPHRNKIGMGGFWLTTAVFVVNLTASTTVWSQDYKSLFSESTSPVSTLAEPQNNILESIRAEAGTQDVRIVDLDLSALDQTDGINLNLFPNLDIEVNETKMERRSANDFSWFGASDDSGSSAILVVKQNNLVGTIRSNGDLYKVRPIGDGKHAVIRIDTTKLPEDHPPEFDELEEQGAVTPEFDVAGDANLGDEGTVITTLVAYTTAVRAALGSAAAVEGMIQVAVDETNQSYANSGIPLRLLLVHSYETAYNESGNMITDRNKFIDPSDGAMDEVHDLRDEHNADIGILISSGGGFCGIAAKILADESTGFAVVERTCATGNFTFGHEVGHLLGARHNIQADPTTVPFSYGHGFFNQSEHWRTVMSYNCAGGCTRIPYWSDPLVEYQGNPTGTDSQEHNARVLAQTAPVIANFRRTVANADRSGYVWANNSSSNRYVPSATYSYNSAGSDIEIMRSGPGRYTVRFEQLGGSGTPGGNVQVTGYGGDSHHCNAASWSSAGTHFTVNVRCFSNAGVPVDSRYTVLVNWPS